MGGGGGGAGRARRMMGVKEVKADGYMKEDGEGWKRSVKAARQTRKGNGPGGEEGKGEERGKERRRRKNRKRFRKQCKIKKEEKSHNYCHYIKRN